MKTYKDIFTKERGVFDVLKEVNPELYEALFGTLPTDNLDGYTYFKASEKLLVPVLDESMVITVITGLCDEFGDTWVRIKNALSVDYDLVRRSTTETLTGDENSEQSHNATDTDSNKGFNSVDFVDSDKKTVQNDNINNRDYSHTKTTIKDVDEPQRLITNELNLRGKRTLFNTVLTDIIHNITLSIYE